MAPGQNGIGPSLAGIFGRDAGKVPGYAYSQAMKNTRKRWTSDVLDAFLVKPQAVIPGTKMVLGGAMAPKDRADIVYYLRVTK